jgi:LysM repeat protein
LATLKGDDPLENNTYTTAVMPAAGVTVPPPPQTCGGQLYTIQTGNTIFGIAQNFSVTVDALLQANPQIVNANVIYVGQVICIPVSPPSACNLRVLTLRFLTEAGEVLPIINGAIQLWARVIVRATFNLPIRIRMISMSLSILNMHLRSVSSMYISYNITRKQASGTCM